jgi:hypothetical protein
MATDRHTVDDDQIFWRARRIITRAKGYVPSEAGRRQGLVIEADLRRLIGDLHARARHIDETLAAAARRLEAVNAYRRCYRLVRKKHDS